MTEHARAHRSDANPRRSRGDRLAVLTLCIAYVTAFWGQAARLLPAPLDQWHSLLFRWIGPWWRQHVGVTLSNGEQLALYQLAEAMIVALLLPAWALHRSGRSWGDAGLRLPDRSALWPTLAGIGICLPFGIYLSRVVPDPWGTPLKEGIELVLVIPEHLLIFGVFSAWLMPAGRLAKPAGRFALGREQFFVILATALIFGLVHIGVESKLVLLASFPLGLINAYVTLRTGSIWPAILAHWTMNVVPMAWDMLSGRWLLAAAALP